ncbi:MAG: hypothetical protein AAF702_34740 [Chloroflexota bacterium]
MYREAIGQFITDKSAKLYVPKNSGLNEYVQDILQSIGVSEVGEFKRPGKDYGQLEIRSVRGEDVPQRVDDCLQRGEVAYGLTGDDLFDEYLLATPQSPLRLLNTYDWFDPSAQFNRPALCLLNRSGELPASAITVSVAVNKKYELTSKRYLAHMMGTLGGSYSVVSYAGDTEYTVSEGTHDWCIEVVYRGAKSANSATSETGLQVADIVRFSDISLIGLEAQ